MATGKEPFGAIRDALDAPLARCAAVVERARDDAELLALRDLLLDAQFTSRGLITAIEERLGAFSGEDDPGALAVHAEALIETVEELQDGWESRVDLLLGVGFDEAHPTAFLSSALATSTGRDRLAEFFAGLAADMDRTAEVLEYAKRYLLTLLPES